MDFVFRDDEESKCFIPRLKSIASSYSWLADSSYIAVTDYLPFARLILSIHDDCDCRIVPVPSCSSSENENNKVEKLFYFIYNSSNENIEKNEKKIVCSDFKEDTSIVRLKGKGFLIASLIGSALVTLGSIILKIIEVI